MVLLNPKKHVRPYPDQRSKEIMEKTIEFLENKGLKSIKKDFHEKSLKEIWLNQNAFLYNRKPSKLSKHCKTCKYSKSCKGGCKSSMDAQGTNFRYNDYCVYHIENSLKN